MTEDERIGAAMMAWFEETAPPRLPHRVLDGTFEETRRTKQRHGWRAIGDTIQTLRLAPALGGAAVVVIAVAVAFSLLDHPKDAAGPGRPEGIFAGVGGWIAFGDDRGIWAIDPARPDDRESLVRLSSERGIPRAWSPDGSKLLVLGAPNVANERDLFTLNADGTTTRLTRAVSRSGGDFTPDGSKVVSASETGVSVIDVAGGTPEPLSAGYVPAFSPDGTQIAYFYGNGDWGHNLRVMNSDGTGMRVVLENEMTLDMGHVQGLDWSADGQHLVFAIDSAGVWVVGVDGSGLREVSSEAFGWSPEGADPHWSPDGSLISYNTGDSVTGEFGALVIVRSDGTPVHAFDYGRSGPWNPIAPD